LYNTFSMENGQHQLLI